MKFRFASALFFIFALFAFTASALPTVPGADVETNLFDPNQVISDLGLVKRHGNTIKVDNSVIVKIMASLKAQVNAKVVVDFSATLCEKVKASLDIKASILGGIISIGDAKIQAIQTATIKKLSAKIQAKLAARLDVSVYADVEVYLRKLCLGKTLTADELLKILIDLEVKVAATIEVKLPEIKADLKADIKAAIAASLKNVEVNIPIIAHITINANVNVDVALKACLDAVVVVCAKIKADAEAEAKALLALL
ncbi:hypothetical protein DFQ28_009905 [Apophysomyces sp. BC1034]|nr:hypothetical protein DFQ30_008283 [Apophysomyces sp. BC1015]KAG0174964.1 hypothetical protein DFQ29_007307 [Apophysomyces sp. BC1021]KAG0185133.1 hypothetical protein DFQ28_009905 [Apophysomyces sp. BC1034]